MFSRNVVSSHCILNVSDLAFVNDSDTHINSLITSFLPHVSLLLSANAFSRLFLSLICLPQHIFFLESYLQSVRGVSVSTVELQCLGLSEICNFTVPFINPAVGTSSPLALSFIPCFSRVGVLPEPRCATFSISVSFSQP